MGRALALNNRTVVQDEGAIIGSFRTFDFVGTGVTATDAGNGVVQISINGASTAWTLDGNTVGSEKFIGTIDNLDFPIYTNNVRRVTVTKTGDVGIGITIPLGTTHIVTPDTDSLTRDTLILSHLNTGTTPAVETGLRFKVWINNFANDAARIYSSSTSITSGDQFLTFQVLGVGSSFVDYFQIGTRACKFFNQYYSKKKTLTDGATIALDWINSNVQYVVLGGNRTFTFATPQDGGRYILILKQDATGSRTVTFPSNVLWAGGTPPTLSTAANTVDIITFVYDETNDKYYSGFNLNYI